MTFLFHMCMHPVLLRRIVQCGAKQMQLSCACASVVIFSSPGGSVVTDRRDNGLKNDNGAVTTD